MGDLDHGAKLALRVDALSIVRLALPSVREVAPLSPQVVSTERTSDAAFLARVGDDEVTVPLEMEAEPTADVTLRVARGACALHFAHGRPVLPVIFFLHPAKGGRRPKSTYSLPVGARAAALRFAHVCLWELEPEEVLSRHGAGLLPFVVFARDATLDHVARAARALERLPLRREQRYDAQAALYMLATTRTQFPRAALGGIIPKEILMKSPGYLEAVDIGLAQGRAEGRAEGLMVVLRARLGEVPAALHAEIQAVAGAGDLARLDRALVAVGQAGSSTDLAERVSAALRAD